VDKDEESKARGAEDFLVSQPLIVWANDHSSLKQPSDTQYATAALVSATMPLRWSSRWSPYHISVNLCTSIPRLSTRLRLHCSTNSGEMIKNEEVFNYERMDWQGDVLLECVWHTCKTTEHGKAWSTHG